MKNALYMLGGVGVGLLASKYSKDIKKSWKKVKRWVLTILREINVNNVYIFLSFMNIFW